MYFKNDKIFSFLITYFCKSHIINNNISNNTGPNIIKRRYQFFEKFIIIGSRTIAEDKPRYGKKNINIRCIQTCKNSRQPTEDNPR